jgi:hypothetical protein
LRDETKLSISPILTHIDTQPILSIYATPFHLTVSGAAKERSSDMISQPVRIPNLNVLREFVYETICRHEQFELGAFQMTERILVRGGRPCGIHFCLHGPRSVKLTAIWETSRNTVLFYGSTGERFHKTELTVAPELATAAA